MLILLSSCSKQLVYLEDEKVYKAEYDKNNNEAQNNFLVKNYSSLPNDYRISAITVADKYSAVGLFKGYEDGYVEVFKDNTTNPVRTLSDTQIIGFTDYNGPGSIIVDSMDFTGRWLEINFKITGASDDTPESPVNSVLVDINDLTKTKYYSALDPLSPMDNYLNYNFRTKELTNPAGNQVSNVPPIEKFDANF